MRIKKKYRTASQTLEDVIGSSNKDTISFGEIKKGLHERGFGLLMILFALIMVVLPPGLTAIPAIPIFVFAVQMVMAADSPWLPKWLSKKKIQRKKLSVMVEKSSPYLKKIEKFLKPRLTFASSRIGERIVGLFAMIFSISILIPLPLTNFIPAIGVILMSLGLISKDGVLVIIGMIAGSIGVSFTLSILFFGKKFISNLPFF